MTGGSSIVTISIILSIPVIISGHNAFGSEYDTTLMTWKGIEGDQRIFYSVYGYASNSWSPGAPIEGANTNLSPSLVSLPNGALLVWKGIEGDQRIFYSVYDRGSDSWSPATNIEGANTNRIISLSSLPGGNKVLMTWKGVEGDQRIFYSVYDYASNSWSPGAPVEGANTNLSPSLIGVAHIPTVLMTWKGIEGDQRIFYSVYDYASNSWSPATNIEGANTSTDPSTTDTVRVTTTTTPPPTTTTTTPPPTPTSCPNPPSGLVAWWPGDGSADDVLGNNDGILQNGASFGSGIAGGQAFRLDGVNGYVQIPSMNIGNTFSIDFWVYPELSAGNYEHLISNHFASSDHFGALYLHYGNLQYWQNGQVLFFPPTGSQTIQPNTWSHITLTYNGSDTEIYINGNKVANAASPASGTTQHSETFNNALRIGSSDPHESSYFRGLIDDVGLYNCVLSESEIQAVSSGADKSTFTTTNGTTTTTTTPPPTTTDPSIAAVTLHPDSVPQFFKCGETPYNGLPTLPGLDAETSANTAIIDGDVNTEILGRAIFDVTFSEPIRNGPGPDLIVYEMGNATEPFNVALFTGGDVLTEFIEYSAVASTTGDTDDCAFIINTAEIDLSDFGIEEETTTISGIRVDNLGAEGCCVGADISDVVIFSTAATSAEVENVPLLSEQQQQQPEGETEPATVSGGNNNTEPESETEEVAEPEPSDSGDEG